MIMRTIAFRRAATAGCALLAAALSLSACTTPAQGPFHFAEFGPGPAVFDFETAFRPGSAELPPAAAQALRERVAATLVRPSDTILVFTASTGVPEVDAARPAAVRAALAGIPGRLQVAALPPGAPDFDANAVVVQVRRDAALVVACPSQGTDFVDQAYGRDTLSMGCTNAINLASQANNPRELVAPGRLTGSDAAASVAAVNRYRAGEVKAYPPLSSTTFSGSF